MLKTIWEIERQELETCHFYYQILYRSQFLLANISSYNQKNAVIQMSPKMFSRKTR